MAYDPTVFVNVPEGEDPPEGASDMDAGELNKFGNGIKAAHDDLAAHAADTTSVHGIADTSALETTTGSAAKIATHAGASDPHGDRAFATAAVATHEADTTNVHGIASTAALETTTGSAAKVTAHAGATDPHGDRAYTDTAVAGRTPLVRATSVSYAGTVTPNADTTDVLNVGTLTGALTLAAPSGTPRDGQNLRIRFAQDATGGRAITFNAAYAFGTDVTTGLIPTAASARWEMLFTWHAGDAKWRAVSIVRGF